MISFLLVSLFAKLYCDVPSSWKSELQRKPQRIASWLQQHGSSSSIADPEVEIWKEPDAPVNNTEAFREGGTPFITWMESTGITTKRVPLITIADSKYTRAIRNLKARLEKWGRGSDLIVICLDLACAEEESFRGYGGYVDGNGEPMEHVALIKVQSARLKFLAMVLISHSFR